MSDGEASGFRLASARRLALLGVLYFAQGLPFGFQSKALPVLLREGGASLTAISFASALSLPWLLKWLWAPLVDRFGSERFGRRKSWIVPLQALLALACVGAALGARSESLGSVLVMVGLMNLLAATQDIATDGLAVDALSPRELGLGNAGQVVGYKLGMLTSGGLLVALVGDLGFQAVFLAMGALCVLVLLLVLPTREAALRRRAPTPAPVEPAPLASWSPSSAAWVLPEASPEAPAIAPTPRSLREVVREVWAALRQPGLGWALAFIATYKTGESLIDVMFKPFLVDAGFTRVELGLWSGTWGMGASIVGSLAGGLLASRLPRLTAVGLCALLRLGPLLFQWWLAARGAPTEGEVITVILAEEFLGGALTTSMFAFMMGLVDRRVGATHYTVLAALEVAGKSPATWLAGPLAQTLGYAPLFALGCALSAGFLALWLPVRHEQERAGLRPSSTDAASG